MLTFLLILQVFTGYGACGDTYINPVVDSDHPDPGVLKLDDGTFVAVTTRSSEAEPMAFPILTSPDLVNWTHRGYVFPPESWPSWASENFWAPEIHLVNNNYIVYFSASHKESGKFSIGAAVSNTGEITGPYADLGWPLVEDFTDPKSGVIDVHHFYDLDGTAYLFWKRFNMFNGEADIIYMRKINKDGVSFDEDEPVLEVIRCTEDWEGGIVEGPWVVFRSGFYYLFFSSGNSFAANYCVSVARSEWVRGPYEKYNKKILQKEDVDEPAFIGPGHGSVVQAGESDWLVYHAWHGDGGSYTHRAMLLDKVEWSSDGWPMIRQGYPTHTPQDAPKEA